nr:MAG TPA: hypothetical protein [Caudoviricetes sp.]
MDQSSRKVPLFNQKTYVYKRKGGYQRDHLR